MAAKHPEIQGQTHYDVLGLPVSPSQISLREIKAAYHRALLTAHPDKVSGSSGAEVDLVREAWRVLSNDVLRKEYDAKIKSTRLRLTLSLTNFEVEVFTKMHSFRWIWMI
jgi:curved DNA-binding protein CbpA